MTDVLVTFAVDALPLLCGLVFVRAAAYLLAPPSMPTLPATWQPSVLDLEQSADDRELASVTYGQGGSYTGRVP